MQVNRKYTAIAFDTEVEDGSIMPSYLCHGFHQSFRYDLIKTEFNTEDEAIKYAYNMFPKSKWMIIPIVSFDEENNGE